MSERERMVNVRQYRKSIGRRCMHCGRPATVKATRVDRHSTGKLFRLEVRYCGEHAVARGALDELDKGR